MNDELGLFRPIRAKRVSDEAVDQVTRLIEEGRLKAGDRLPSERELTEHLSISRTAVREALRLLEAQRIIEVFPGRGTFVLDWTGIGGLAARWRNWLRDHQAEVVDLLIVRKALEPLAAALAAKASEPQLLEGLKLVLARMAQDVREGNVPSAVSGDVRFHELISEMGSNSFLIELNKSSNTALTESRYAYYSIPARAQASIKQHCEVFHAIRAGDHGLAAKAMAAHIQSTLDFISNITFDEAA